MLFGYFFLSAFTIDIINDKNWLKKWYNVLKLIIVGLLICLYRHNGILVMLIYAIIFIIIFHKNKVVYLIGAMWLCYYLFLTTVGFKVLNIKENNYANKYGPVTHISAKMLNDDIKFTSKELETLNKFADVNSLKESYNLYNMDYNIATHNMDYLKSHGKDYLIFALKMFRKYPQEVITSSLLNILSLAPAMPVASLRYIYITILTFWITVPWAIIVFLDKKIKSFDI